MHKVTKENQCMCCCWTADGGGFVVDVVGDVGGSGGNPFLCEGKVHFFSGLFASQLHTVRPTFALFSNSTLLAPVSSLVH